MGGKTRAHSIVETAPIITKEAKQTKAKNKTKKTEVKPAEKAGGSEFTFTAPMPGMVVGFEVKEGDEVGEGDVLVILEAMKMQNSLTSSVAGTIRSLKVAPGASVEKNQVLLTISQ